MRLLSSAPHRRCRLNSNVRHHTPPGLPMPRLTRRIAANLITGTTSLALAACASNAPSVESAATERTSPSQRSSSLSSESCSSLREYPRMARAAEVTGTTVVEVTYSTDGKPLSAVVVQSAGPVKEHKLLDSVSVEHARSCTTRSPKEGSSTTTRLSYRWALH